MRSSAVSTTNSPFIFRTVNSVTIDGMATQQTQTTDFYEKLDDFFFRARSVSVCKSVSNINIGWQKTQIVTHTLSSDEPFYRKFATTTCRLIRIWVNKRKNVFWIRHRALNSLSICLSSISLNWCPIFLCVSFTTETIENDRMPLSPSFATSFDSTVGSVLGSREFDTRSRHKCYCFRFSL